jgi:RNA recognition motif-containing protein
VTTRETTAAVNGKKNKNGEEEPQTSQSDNASVASDASSSRAAPRRPRRKNKNKAKNPDAAAAIAERRRIKKELTEPSQTTLFVANIPYSSTDETLQEVFKNYKVASAHVARMRK